jgi:hypothetical protein
MDQAAQQGTTAWWRVSMVWLVIAGPLAVVIAGVVIAARGADPVVRASARQAPVPALAPAMQGRNHAATPRH